MKMVKLTEDHYIVVNDKFDPIDSDRKYVHKSGRIWQWDSGMAYVSNNPPQPITHSTQPEFLGTGWMQSVLPLLLSEVKEVLGVVDVEKKALEISPIELDEDELDVNETHRVTWIDGYNQALEDNKERKYTEKDLRAVFMHGFLLGVDRGVYSLDMENKALSTYTQPSTEWEVELVDGKLKLKS